MAWSTAISEGFLLAATLAGDRHAELGRRALSGVAVTAVDALMTELSAADDRSRRARIAAISRRAHAPLSTHIDLAPRALALLACFADGERGRRWLAAAPATRIGYRAEPGLRRSLRMIAEHGRWRA